MSGIYLITCKGKSGGYVGKTSRSFDARWSEHKKELLEGKHPNDVLQAAVDKFRSRDRGIKSLNFKVLEECAIADLAIQEIVWIAKMGSWNECPSQAQAKRQLQGVSAKKQSKSKGWRLPADIRFLLTMGFGLVFFQVAAPMGFVWGAIAGAIGIACGMIVLGV